MQSVYAIVVFNKEKKGKKLPKTVIINKESKNYSIQLYDDESNKSIKSIKQEIEKLKILILKLNDKDVQIVTNCFRHLIDVLDLPLDMRRYNVYDMHITDPIYDVTSGERAIEHLKSCEIKPYQKVFANSSIVYADMERKGLLFNHSLVSPIWSQDTYSGRSKSTGFNIQGFSEKVFVHNVSALEGDLLVHFDWICADIRVASLLSGDENLKRSFVKSDPYKFLMKSLNNLRSSKGLEEVFDRDECKLILLKGINSLDCGSIVFSDVYPELGEWIKNVTSHDSAVTMMDRRFHITEDKTKLSVFNGVMQGSVAHAMQNVIRRVWEKLGNRLICDIHDSIVLNVANDRVDIKSVINIVSEIMLDPFGDGQYFPLKISVGKKWREYSYLRTVYNPSELEVL